MNNLKNRWRASIRGAPTGPSSGGRPSHGAGAVGRTVLLVVALSGAGTILFTLAIAELMSESMLSGLDYFMILGLFLLLMAANYGWLARTFPGESVWLHPSSFLLGWIFVMYALPGSYVFLGNIDDVGFLSFLYNDLQITYKDLTCGMWLVLYGSLILTFTYAVSVRLVKPVEVLGRLHGRVLSKNNCIYIYVLILCFQILRIAVTGVAYGSDRSRWGSFVVVEGTLNYIERGNLMILAACTIKAARREWSHRHLLWMTAAQAAIAFTSGFTRPLIFIYIIIVISLYVSKINIRLLLFGVVLLSPLLVAFVPIVEGTRKSETGTSSRVRDLGAAADTAFSAFRETWGQGFEVGWKIFLDKLIGRQVGVIHMPGLIMVRTPSVIPHEGIGQFLNIPLYIVPRFIWRDKPILSRGTWITTAYLDAPEDTESSSAATIFGEGYIFAGWTGTAITCAALGLCLALIYRNSVSVGLTPVYLGTIPGLLDVEGQFTTIFVGIIQQYFIIIFIYILITDNRRSLRC